MTENLYYEYFKSSLKGPNDQEGGKYYDSTIGHVYSAPKIWGPRTPIFPSSPYSMRGNGFGNILTRLFQWSQPLIKRIGKKVFDSASNIVSNVASDAVQGDNIIQSVKKHGIAEGKHLLEQVPQNITNFLSKTNDTSAEEFSSNQDTVKKGPQQSIHFKTRKRKREPKRRSDKRKFGTGAAKKQRTNQEGRGSYFSQYPALNFM